MMTFQVNSSLPAAKAVTSERSSAGGRSHHHHHRPHHPHHHHHAAAGRSAYRSVGTGAGQAALRQNNYTRTKLPAIQPLSRSRDGESLVGGFIFAGSPGSDKDASPESENTDPEDICGRHFLFDKKSARFERTRTVFPPLQRDYRVHRPGNLRPFSFARELSHGHAAGQPFTLGYPERYELNPGPAAPFLSTLYLKGRNTLSVESCNFSRPKANHQTYNLSTVKDQKSQSYPDPVVGASRSFIHKVSKLSSLEAETVRQEKLKKTRKPPS